ncbi:MAG: hypothetical protein U0T84_05505 [Chitinophagales bacterium]
MKIAVRFWLFIVLPLSGCHLSSGNGNEQEPARTLPEPAVAVAKWKKELLDSKQLGSPCREAGGDSVRGWQAKNPNQDNAWPASDRDVTTVQTDLNDDGENELLLYFQSENCSGHNGGTPAYAKLIYADGKEDAHLMEEIRKNILIEYNRKRSTDSTLPEVTNQYLDGTTTMVYGDSINGEFQLYKADDAHCCPSFNGSYAYYLNPVRMHIQLHGNQ